LSLYLSLDFVCDQEKQTLQHLVGSIRSGRAGACGDVREGGGNFFKRRRFCLSDHSRLKEEVVFLSESGLCQSDCPRSSRIWSVLVVR
jgi:hypothetical protein